MLYTGCGRNNILYKCLIYPVPVQWPNELGRVQETKFAELSQAQALTRTFVSSTGVDSNPCNISQPCATFAHAYNVTAQIGIIAARSILANTGL